MAISIAVATILSKVIPDVLKFGGSFRKEAITLGALTPAIISVFNSYQASCVDECSWMAVSGEQWAALIGAVIALSVHLYAKHKEIKAK